ncbi:hypothetical protein L4B25_25640 [Salmonella enterica subsp. diarizonae serovar 16:z10:e,n,x,z15]|uniref:glyoxalase superfamily protein n=1 Tax=Salmonella enterica TaxID=28901 RepID=UPI0009AF2BB4|nr:glyoxalase superfamily protein [Salmonella enterica]EIK6739721.1 hypothetical protein [Salmonella enterica subsp. enterica serovar Aqua]MCH5485283.1 hypothetical protein [Salmonella enterica subsp. diarizonae serovar 16:z10:e,n,x,z15]WGI49212.1 glyoxalase superfamily protein [Salmonella enterica subsp. diarizonae serovar 48:i:z]MCH5495684.1 hypothetical protein [Salmonella enterica subsp. diarizonae serovar 16:z10:e,n,x,z15]MCH5506506.1 hypothetical protein [Salmonella enterica subsp. diari
MNSTSLLQARCTALHLAEHQSDIQQAADGFIVEGGLNIRQLKLHARHTRNRLAAAGVAVKLNHALELVSCVHGFRDWQAALAGLRERDGV